MNKDSLPDCFGNQAESLLCGEMPDACLKCQLFDKCHKITVAASLQSISSVLDLMVQNGLTDGRLKGFQELEKIWDAEETRKQDEKELRTKT